MASLYRKPIQVRDPKTGKRTQSKSKKWWGRFRAADGHDKRVPLAVDRAAAQALLAEHVRRAERERAGLVEPSDQQRKRPISKHLADYRRYLVAKENSPRYVDLAIGRLEALVGGCKFRSIAHFSAAKITTWLRAQRDAAKFGIATSNDYLVAVKALCNWLVRENRLPQNPLAHVRRLNAQTDVRRRRRVLAPDELQRLLKAAETRRRGGMSGPQRAMLYRLAAFTGLRAQELASLSASSFALDASPPTVRVEACYSKHRRTDVLPLQEELANHVRDYLSEQAAGDATVRLWPGRWYRKAARLLQADLAAARKAWIKEASDHDARRKREESDYLRAIDHRGQVADFHALRHGFISYLVTANVPPKVAQALARHSTITLTMDRYAHLAVGDMASALAHLPALSGRN